MVLSVGFCGHLERCAPLVLDAIRRSSLAERHHFFDTNIHVAHHWNTNLPRVADNVTSEVGSYLRVGFTNLRGEALGDAAVELGFGVKEGGAKTSPGPHYEDRIRYLQLLCDDKKVRTVRFGLTLCGVIGGRAKLFVQGSPIIQAGGMPLVEKARRILASILLSLDPEGLALGTDSPSQGGSGPAGPQLKREDGKKVQKSDKDRARKRANLEAP